jgi:hypothetical protein
LKKGLSRPLETGRVGFNLAETAHSVASKRNAKRARVLLLIFEQPGTFGVTISRVMHEFKHRELESSSGQKVKNPKQTIAIGLSEAGASKYESKETNRKNLERTKARMARQNRQGRARATR